MTHKAFRRAVLAAAVGAALLPGLGLAEEIEEIIVTAQKRPEVAQDVPIAITAFDSQALKTQQIATFGDIRFAAPNVAYTNTNFGGNNFSIRGILP